jgi:hypothetical protein
LLQHPANTANNLPSCSVYVPPAPNNQCC